MGRPRTNHSSHEAVPQAPAAAASSAPPLLESSLLSHLLELRTRLVRIVMAVLVMFIPLAIFYKEVFRLVFAPLVAQWHGNEKLISTSLTGTITVPLKLAGVVAIGICMPWILYQIWAFIAPGLYKHERRLVVPLILSSTLLFYVGVVFAYFVALPMMFSFFAHASAEIVTLQPDTQSALDMVLSMTLAFGLIAEVPIAVVLLVWTGFVRPEKLAEFRGYVLLLCFVVGMLLSPPEVLAQCMLAIPMYLLFEVGLLIATYIDKYKRRKEDSSA